MERRNSLETELHNALQAAAKASSSFSGSEKAMTGAITFPTWVCTREMLMSANVVLLKSASILCHRFGSKRGTRFCGEAYVELKTF